MADLKGRDWMDRSLDGVIEIGKGLDIKTGENLVSLKTKWAAYYLTRDEAKHLLHLLAVAVIDLDKEATYETAS